METQMSGKAHFPYGVMHFVKLPHPIYPVQHNMYCPLNNIRHDKHNYKLPP